MYYDFKFECVKSLKTVTVTALSFNKAEINAKFQLKTNKVRLLHKRINLVKTQRGF